VAKRGVRPVTAAVVAATTLIVALAGQPAWAQADPNPGAMTITGNIDLLNQYMFRGLRQNSTGMVLWPSFDLGIALHEGKGGLKTAGVNFGTWNSLHTGDTELGPYLYRDEFANASIVIAECTFFESDHRSRARVGKHMHVEDIASLLEAWKAQAVVLVHLSRRTNLPEAREALVTLLGAERASRVHFLMDLSTNRRRYEQQSVDVASDAK